MKRILELFALGVMMLYGGALMTNFEELGNIFIWSGIFVMIVGECYFIYKGYLIVLRLWKDLMNQRE